MKYKVVLVLLIVLLGATTLVFAQGSPVLNHVGRQPADVIMINHKDAGNLEFWNTRYNFMVDMELADDWLVHKVQVYAGKEMPPVKASNGKPIIEEFNCIREYRDPQQRIMLSCNLKDELEFTWGHDREVNAAIHVDMVKLSDKGKIIRRNEAWVYYEPTAIEWSGSNWGWYLETAFTHPARGHFIDSPVGGISYKTPTQEGVTDLSGGFDYFPGEVVELAVGPVALGSTVANHKISPLDIFENADTTDDKVLNMARLLQSLDADAAPKQGIEINEEATACLDHAYHQLGLSGVDYANDTQIENLIHATIDACAEAEATTLVAVSKPDAKANLDKALDSSMFRKNISRTPELTSSKSKLNIMGVWFPALRANGEPAYYLDGANAIQLGIPYYDEAGNLIRVAEEAKPIVVAYTDAVEATGDEDIWAAISRDDGNTFKRKNLSRAADKTSFNLVDGTPYYGDAKKPVFQVKGNNILVAWTSKYCNGGKPTYAINTCDDPTTETVETPETGCAVYCTGKEEDGTLSCEADYPYDDPYYEEDIWGVSGPQRSVDYAEQGFPEVGEVPYSCVWTARGTIVTQKMLDSSGGNNYWANNAYVVGDIVWFKPERLTSGRRDANQVFMGASDGAGFAIAWQEDPEGLRPGGADGPGPGWGGATTNHKTDIWYSYITIPNFAKVDTHFEAGGDPQHEDPELVGRPKALVPMSLPVRLSDNDTVNSDNIMAVREEDGTWTPVINPDTSGEGTGSHAYGYVIPGLCDDYYTFTNYQEEVKEVCVTSDDRLLDGDTGASRPNLFLQTYTKNDGTKSAWAIMAYEETKGVGGGAPDYAGTEGPHGDEYVPDVGKNVIYHSFDFQNPPLVSAGDILNLPETDEDGNLVYLREGELNDETGEIEYGEYLLDYLGQKQLAYENARRPRFILQGKGAIGAARTPLLVLYKEGQEGQGRPSDIMMRRFFTPGDQTGNPYRFSNATCELWADVYPEVADSPQVCVDGALNMSSVSPTATWINPDREESARGDGVKVTEWVQTVENLADRSGTNPYDDARAHRGSIRGDFVTLGFSYTANWAAARNGNDKYDFFIRRSFDGGQTWTTDPVGSGVEHCMTFTDYTTVSTEADTNSKEKYEICTFYPAGEFEQMRNLSQLANNKSSVIEPRIVAPPGTIKVDGVPTGKAEDVQNPDIFYVSYGTATNPGTIHGDSDEEEEFPAPMDLYYSFSIDRGESYVEVEWEVNPDSEGNYAGETVTRWDYLAKGDSEQGEAQLRMTPDGSRFYATWLQEGEEGSDIWFRRIMSPVFSSNVAQVAEAELQSEQQATSLLTLPGAAIGVPGAD